jgi:hypothetical protein
LYLIKNASRGDHTVHGNQNAALSDHDQNHKVYKYMLDFGRIMLLLLYCKLKVLLLYLFEGVVESLVCVVVFTELFYHFIIADSVLEHTMG